MGRDTSITPPESFSLLYSPLQVMRITPPESASRDASSAIRSLPSKTPAESHSTSAKPALPRALILAPESTLKLPLFISPRIATEAPESAEAASRPKTPDTLTRPPLSASMSILGQSPSIRISPPESAESDSELKRSPLLSNLIEAPESHEISLMAEGALVTMMAIHFRLGKLPRKSPLFDLRFSSSEPLLEFFLR